MLIWFSLYYFTFEMKIIQIALNSSTPQDYQVRLRLYTPLKWSILVFLIVYGLLMSTLAGIQAYNENYTHVLVKLIVKSLKLLADIYMHITFIALLRFFIEFKVKSSQGTKLTSTNKISIVWIIFLFILSLINVTFVFSQVLIQYFDPAISADGTFVDSLFNFVAVIIYPLKDFLIAISFAALYLYQSINHKKKRKIEGRKVIRNSSINNREYEPRPRSAENNKLAIDDLPSETVDTHFL